jgi:hypothetical protein
VSRLVGNSDAGGELGRRVSQRVAQAGVEQRLIFQGDVAGPDLPGAQVARIRGYDDEDGMLAAFAGIARCC